MTMTLLSALRIVMLALVMLPLTVVGAAADKPIVLKWAEFSTPTVRTQAVEWWIAEVQKRSGGRVKIESYLSGSLVKAMDIPAAVRAGTVDMGTLVAAYYPDRIPAWTVVDVAGLTDPYAVMMAMWDLYDSQPAMQADFDKWNARLILPQSVGETLLVFRQDVRSLAGFRGKKVRAVGYQGMFMNAVGAVPIPLPHPEIHLSLERGVIDGALGFAYSILPYGYHEIAKYWIRGVPGNYAIPVVMNKDSWGKLPKDIQDLMLAVAKEATKRLADDLARVDSEAITKAGDLLKDKGALVTLPEADVKQWMTSLEAVQDKWVKDMESKGIPGNTILGAYREAVKRHQAK
jgi:TRAP-type transport system periplasmic protein